MSLTSGGQGGANGCQPKRYQLLILHGIITKIWMPRKVFAYQAHELSVFAFRIVCMLTFHKKRAHGAVVSIELFEKPAKPFITSATGLGSSKKLRCKCQPPKTNLMSESRFDPKYIPGRFSASKRKSARLECERYALRRSTKKRVDLGRDGINRAEAVDGLQIARVVIVPDQRRGFLVILHEPDL